MSRILFTMQPYSGHWHPLVPLARALESAGHEVAFASTPGFCPTIEAAGLLCFRAGVDETAEELEQRRRTIGQLEISQRAPYMQREIFAGTWARRTLPELLNIISEWHPDLLVRDNTEYAGCVAAVASGIPHAVIQLAGIGPGFLQNIDAPLRHLCDLVGVTPTDPADLMYRYLLLLPRPFKLWNPDFPAPPTLHSFRYVGFSGSGGEELPEWIADLERPTIYATLGTVANYATDVLSAMLEGLRDEPANLILTLGRDRDPAEFGEQPANVHIERYIPQDLLLSYCDLVVTHGGSGTMLDALSHGIPMVMIPYAADQPLNARFCAQEGVARVVRLAEHTGPGQLAQAIKEAARDVLENPQYRLAAQRLRDEIDALPGLTYAVALLERLIAERAPILAQLPAS